MLNVGKREASFVLALVPSVAKKLALSLPVMQDTSGQK